MRRIKNNLIAGLDIGTSKVCVCIGTEEEDGLQIRGIGRADSKGIEKGIVTDISGMSDSIQAALEAAEAEAGVEIHTVFVGISGPQLHGSISEGLRFISSREKKIGHEDVRKAFESARSKPIPLNREVIHLLPQECIVDGEGGITNPAGMYGEKLETRLYVITNLVSVRQSLMKAINHAGLNVEAFVASPLAAARSALLPEEKNDGVILADIGAGTTDIAIFKKNVVKYTYILLRGGDFLTEAIAAKFNIPITEAERLKQSYGSIAYFAQDKEKISAFRSDQRRCEIPRREMARVIDKAAGVLLDEVKEHLEKIPAAKDVFCGAVFSGGVSKLEGFLEKAEECLNLPVRMGIAKNFVKPDARISNPSYTAGLGLLCYGRLERGSMLARGGKRRGFFYKISEALRNLVEDYF